MPRLPWFWLAAWGGGCFPSLAFADDASAAASWSDAAARASSPDYQPYSYAHGDAQVQALANSDDYGYLPPKYDLRSKGVVTPVKLQNPWGTCWGFAAIAAAETSILSELGTTYAANGLDLSERQLVYFAGTSVPDYGALSNNQAGEGTVYNLSPDDPAYNPNRMFTGGFPMYATSVFSAGVGPAYEEDAPYQNDEGYMVCKVLDPGAEDTTPSTTTKTLNQAGIDALKAEGKEVTPLYYASTYEKEDGTQAHATWSLGDEFWLSSAYELEESFVLPEMRILEADPNNPSNPLGTYVGLDEEAVKAVKDQICNHGRGVTIGFAADTSQPDQNTGEAQYINQKTWAHYTYDIQPANHAVTIVGWDDNYEVTNFNSGHQPEKPGAWLVKNSWGSEEEGFPNGGNWGIEENGKHTGYFWLSYYDKTIQMPESFDFDVNIYSEEPEYIIDQYNYLVSSGTLTNAYDYEAPSANVFTAIDDLTLRTLTCETVKPNTEVTYKVYLLDDAATNPTAGELRYEGTQKYEYGGFHRVTLPEEEWIPMRDGQRYSVVITQHCLDDDKYYQSAAIGQAGYTEQQEADMRMYFGATVKYEVFMTKYQERHDYYISQGDDEETADNKATNDASTYLEQPDVETYINERVESMVKERLATVQNGVVNPGESWTFVDGAWTDWSGVVTGLEMANSTVAYDNFPIKAYSHYADYASVESLSELAAQLDAMEKLVASLTVSADGSDVPQGSSWITQEDYDDLMSGFAAIRPLLADAGENWQTTLVSTTPTQEMVDNALNGLAELPGLIDEVKKPGTKVEQEIVPPLDDNTKPNAKGNGKGSLAQAGDPAHDVAVLACCLAALGTTAAVGARVARRSRR